MAKHSSAVPSTRRTRLALVARTVAGALALTVAGLGSASAWADAYVDPCDDPTQISMPCTTH